MYADIGAGKHACKHRVCTCALWSHSVDKIDKRRHDRHAVQWDFVEMASAVNPAVDTHRAVYVWRHVDMCVCVDLALSLSLSLSLCTYMFFVYIYIYMYIYIYILWSASSVDLDVDKDIASIHMR